MTTATPTPTPAPFVDPAAPGFFAGPYPTLARVREEAPVHRHPVTQSWTLLRDADVDRALRDDAVPSNMARYAPDTPRMRMIAAVGGRYCSQTTARRSPVCPFSCFRSTSGSCTPESSSPTAAAGSATS